MGSGAEEAARCVIQRNALSTLNRHGARFKPSSLDGPRQRQHTRRREWAFGPSTAPARKAQIFCVVLLLSAHVSAHLHLVSHPRCEIFPSRACGLGLCGPEGLWATNKARFSRDDRRRHVDAEPDVTLRPDGKLTPDISWRLYARSSVAFLWSAGQSRAIRKSEARRVLTPSLAKTALAVGAFGHLCEKVGTSQGVAARGSRRKGPVCATVGWQKPQGSPYFFSSSGFS